MISGPIELFLVLGFWITILAVLVSRRGKKRNVPRGDPSSDYEPPRDGSPPMPPGSPSGWHGGHGL